MSPNAGPAGEFLQGRIQQDPAVAAFNRRHFSRRAQGFEDLLSLLGLRVKPSEGNKIFVQKLANGVRFAATARANDAQSQHTRLRQKLAAASKRKNQLFAKTGNPIEQAPE